jgi:hypothetical protein
MIPLPGICRGGNEFFFLRFVLQKVLARKLTIRNNNYNIDLFNITGSITH